MFLLIRAIISVLVCSVAIASYADEKITSQPRIIRDVNLTSKERAWLAKHNYIRIAYDGTLPPYSFAGEDGEFKGIAIDIIRILGQRLDIKFKTYPNVSWNRLYKAAAARKIDVVATMVDRPERKFWFNFTQPYLKKSLVFMARQDNASINSRDDLKNKRIALAKGYQYGEKVIKEFPNAKPYFVDTMPKVLKAVADGKADAAVTFFATADFYLKHGATKDLKFVDFFDRNSGDESIAVRKDWPILKGILQKGLNSISEDEIQKIFAGWVLQGDPAAVTPKTTHNDSLNSTEQPVVRKEELPNQPPPPIQKPSTMDQYLALIKENKEHSVPFFAILSFLLAWLVHSHSQNRKIIQSNNQILISNRNLQGLQSDLESLILKRTAQLNSSEQKFRSLVENLRNEYFFYHHDISGVYTYVSPSITNILGYSPEDFMVNYRKYLTENSINEKITEYTELCTLGVPNPPYQVEIYDAKQIVHWLEIVDSPVYDEYGNCIGVDGIVHDITVRKLADERLIRLSYYDELTGLANRRLFTDRLQQTLNLANRNKSSVALFYLDLDHFKDINDRMGHAAGDEILKEASRRLISTLRDSDVAARLGGDEFVLLLPGTDAAAAVQVAKKILKMFRKPYLLTDTTAALGASIGIAVYPQNGREGETLVNRADTAMYNSKKNNLGFSFYSENMEQAVDQF